MRTTLDITEGLIGAVEFWSKTALADDSSCIIWMGSADSHGYGRIKRGGRQYFAHRIALALEGRELSDNLPIDHLCRNTLCVNPEHLEQVTTRVNTARGNGATAMKIRAADQGRCINGHVLAEVGVHRQRNSTTCAQCGRDRVRRYNERKVSA